MWSVERCQQTSTVKFVDNSKRSFMSVDGNAKENRTEFGIGKFGKSEAKAALEYCTVEANYRHTVMWPLREQSFL